MSQQPVMMIEVPATEIPPMTQVAKIVALVCYDDQMTFWSAHVYDSAEEAGRAIASFGEIKSVRFFNVTLPAPSIKIQK